MKQMLLIFLIPLSVFGEASGPDTDFYKSGCSTKFNNDFFENVERCDLNNRVYNLGSDCDKWAFEIMNKHIKECIKEYQDKPWWKKL
jgi:hypothetical protein